MSCFLEKEDGRVNAVLSFRRSELLYDVRNCAYIEGSVMDTAQGHLRHMVQDVGEEGNVDRVTRVLDLAVAKCKELLYPYTRHKIHRPVVDDVLRQTKVYGIVLSVPSDFSQTSLNLLERLIHEYLVCKTVGDWLSITNPSKAQVWEVKAEEAVSEIRGSLHARMGRRRRRPHPF